MKICIVLAFLFVFAQIYTVNCQQDGETLEEYFSDIISTLKCRTEDGETSLSRDQTIDLCIHFIIKTSTNSLAKRITYSVKIDEYVALYINDAYNNFSSEYTSDYDIYILAQVNSNAIHSPVTTYIKDGQVYPLQNLVVTLDNQVQKLQWDNGDFTTQEYDSDLKNNFLASTDCAESNCNPQVFVSWIGKDDSGNYMTSAGLRMSRFNKYNDKEFWENAIGLFEQ